MYEALGYITAFAAVLALAYLIWVAIAWGLLTILAAFGATSTITPWVLALPLALASAIFSRR